MKNAWRALRRLPLSAAILAIAIVPCIAFVGMDAWRTFQGRDLVIRQHYAQTANLARSLARHAHDTLQLADSLVVQFRERVEAEGWGPESIANVQRAVAADVANVPQIHGVFVFNDKGDWTAASLAAFPRRLNVADTGSFKYHRDHTDRGVHVGDLLRCVASDCSWIISVTRRVDTPDGRFAGMVLATIAADSLNEFYCTFDVGREGSIGLLTLDGVVAARNPATSTTIGSSASKGILFRELLPKSTVGSFAENFPTDGVARFGSYQTVDGFPFVVVVAQGQQEALAAWRRDAANRLGISVAIASAFLLFAIGLARLIKRQQDAEKRYRLLADHSSDAIVCLNLDETRRYVSPAFTRLTGWTPAEGTCAAPGATIHSDDRAAVSQHLQAMATRSADEMTLRFRYICKNGSVLWVESRARFVAADGREPAQIIANVRDISQSMAAEQEIVALNRKLHELATIDGLTGLFNRRQFDEALLTEWRRALREDDVLSLVLLDVDRFKPYNDRYGHLQGDAALQAVAAVLRAIARRPGDVAARYGGEELALLLPGADADGADRLADMMRAGVEALALEHVDNAPARVVTVSLGVATFWPGAGGLELGPDALIIAADKALYQAKITGRNRVVRSPQPEAAHATSAGLFD